MSEEVMTPNTNTATQETAAPTQPNNVTIDPNRRINYAELIRALKVTEEHILEKVKEEHVTKEAVALFSSKAREHAISLAEEAENHLTLMQEGLQKEIAKVKNNKVNEIFYGFVSIGIFIAGAIILFIGLLKVNAPIAYVSLGLVCVFFGAYVLGKLTEEEK